MTPAASQWVHVPSSPDPDSLGAVPSDTNGDRVVIVNSDGSSTELEPAHEGDSDRPVTELIEQPAKVMRIGEHDQATV